MPSPDIQPYIVSPNIAPLEIRDGVVVYSPGGVRRRKVAICGSSGARQMPWDDPEFECWGINNFWNTARDSSGRLAASRWWEMHQINPDADGPEYGVPIQDKNDMAWIRQCPVPLYTVEPFPENKNAVVWPIEMMAGLFRDYFTCTFAMQIAQVLYEGFEELHVYGLELLWGTKREATVESSCVNWWLGLAEGRGVKLVIPPNIDGEEQWLLTHPYRYGFDYWLERRYIEQYSKRWDHLPTAI